MKLCDIPDDEVRKAGGMVAYCKTYLGGVTKSAHNHNVPWLIYDKPLASGHIMRRTQAEAEQDPTPIEP